MRRYIAWNTDVVTGIIFHEFKAELESYIDWKIN